MKRKKHSSTMEQWKKDFNDPPPADADTQLIVYNLILQIANETSKQNEKQKLRALKRITELSEKMKTLQVQIAIENGRLFIGDGDIDEYE